MRKATATQAPATLPAPAAAAGKGRKQAPAAAVEADEADEGEPAKGTRQWARELARAAEGKGNACRRCVVLAMALAGALETAKTKPGAALPVSFAKANELANLRRGETGDPVASWRLAVQRMRQSFGGADAFESAMGYTVAVDADARALVCTPTKG